MVLPQSMRIKGHKSFNYLYKSGHRFNSSSMVLRVARAQPHLSNKIQKNTNNQSIRFAIVISNKVSKKAVLRNRLRRLFHDHLKSRLYLSKEQTNKWALLTLRANTSISDFNPLKKECDYLLRSAGLIT